MSETATFPVMLTELPDGTVNLTRCSEISGLEHTMHIPAPAERIKAWYKAGADAPFIQDAFPDLSDDQREFLLSGITPEEWDEMSGEEDEA